MSLPRLLAALACCTAGLCTVSEAKTPLYVAGLLPLSKSHAAPNGRSALIGAERAVREINSRSDVLPNYTLVLNVSDTEGDIPVGLDRLYEQLYNPPVKVAIFGPFRSKVTSVLSQVIGRRWNMIQVSPGASTPVLSNREIYPHIFRMLTSAATFGKAQAKMFRQFGWKKIASFHQAVEPHIGVSNELQALVEASNYSTIIGAESFYSHPYEALERLKIKDVRIIVGNIAGDMVRKVFCSAYQLGMYGPDYVWLIPGYFADGWWADEDEGISCTAQELKRAIEGYITVAFSNYGLGDEPGFGGRTPAEFRRLIAPEVGYNISVTDRGTVAVGYDVIWALAIALEEAEVTLSRPLDSYQYGDEEYARAVGQRLYDMKLNGMSGPVQFGAGGYRIGDLLIEQNIDGVEAMVGIYDSINDVLNWLIPTKDLWYHNGGVPPFDSDITQTVALLQANPTALVAVVGVLAALGIVLAIMFLLFNIWKRKHRQIKMSSPKVNNIIAVGIMLAYLGVFLLGIDRAMVDQSALLYICRFRSWIIPMAFTLAFGGMFTKMWRVYSIVIANKTKRKVIKDYYLFAIIAVLLLVDFAILIPWQVIDPLLIKEDRVPIVQTDEDIANRQRRELLYVNCSSNNNTIWTMAMILYKTFVVVFGAFLAWSTRSIKVSGLNDSYYVGLSIYNTVICCVVAVPLSLLNVSSAAVTFALVSGFLLLCITASLCMLFFPKVIAVYRKNDVGNETFTGIQVGTTVGAPAKTAHGEPSHEEAPNTSAAVVTTGEQ